MQMEMLLICETLASFSNLKHSFHFQIDEQQQEHVQLNTNMYILSVQRSVFVFKENENQL